MTTKTVSGRSLVLQTQQQLNRLGYKAGSADGLMGKNTREAIKRFQKQHNIHIDGKSTSALLTLLTKLIRNNLMFKFEYTNMADR